MTDARAEALTDLEIIEAAYWQGDPKTLDAVPDALRRLRLYIEIMRPEGDPDA